ncbi:hypothetical protein E3Q23_00681 [Wallemia mellicola]|uniref:Uncharacterized protein n=3 Tax=Wallemia mellicola TaxID=1708541 RepID=A0A4T0RJD2_9BASI|nr:hypothetical protein E3Q23_00681 [Wallemia mellicola]TIB93874.1 hypothetical protein E3Q19_00723 [Wallemia mellicola]TIC13614.1 hypothetical protein E3Q15_02016 [Wallemia mellicola]TIC14264.1 hypothetical protein E3Q14_00996 [Wallemia mellicola]TIC32760.1 hypothetical protein E3Q10_01007 [Wallemia mellicola]
MPLIVREDLSYESTSSKSFTPSSQGKQQTENHGITGGVIAAIVIASIIIVAAICAIMTYIIRTRRDKMEERKSSRFANSVGKKNVSPTLMNARSKLREKISSESPPLSIKSPSSASSFGEKRFYDEEEDFGNLKTPLPKLLHGFEVNSESYSLVTPSPTNSTFATQQMASLKSPSYPSIPSTPTYIDDLPQSPLESPTADVRTVKLSFVPTMSDEIAVMTGDTVLLLKEWDDGWAFVVKLNKEGEFKEEGVIPLESLVDKTPQSRNFTQSVKSIPSRMSLTKPSISSIGSRRSGVRHSSIRV